MSEEKDFEVTIENPITVSDAAKLAKLSKERIQQLCRMYQATKGESGLKSKMFGHIWQVEKEAAENYERTNRGPKSEPLVD